MNDLFKENYQAIVDRGLITEKTTDDDFFVKLIEEKNEIYKEIEYFPFNDDRLNEEITDALNVCANWLIHRGCDPETELKKCLERQKERVKNQ